LVLVSGEYNSAPTPALLNLLDHFPPAIYRHKPCSVVTYSVGPLGGCRARMQLMPFVSELGMIFLPSALIIPKLTQVDLSEEGESADEQLMGKVKKVSEEMAWYVQMMEEFKEKKGTPN